MGSFFATGSLNTPFSRTYSLDAAALLRGPVSVATVYQRMVLMAITVRPRSGFTYSPGVQSPFGLHFLWQHALPALLDGAGVGPLPGVAGVAYSTDLQNTQLQSQPGDNLLCALNSAWVSALQPGQGISGWLDVDVVGYLPGASSAPA